MVFFQDDVFAPITESKSVHEGREGGVAPCGDSAHKIHCNCRQTELDVLMCDVSRGRITTNQEDPSKYLSIYKQLTRILLSKPDLFF